MNDELRKLRFKEIGPLKDALLAVQRRVVNGYDSLMRTDEGRELKLRIDLLTLKTKDSKLAELCDTYVKECASVDNLWNECAEAVEGANDFWQDAETDRKVKALFEEKNGWSHYAEAKRLYVELSEHLDLLFQ